MSTKIEIETFIANATSQMGYFQHPNPALLGQPLLDQFVDAGFGLLRYYQQSGDANIDDDIVGAYVDCAMAMHALLNDDSLDATTRKRAEEYMIGLEDLVNAITHAVEKNIAAAR
jgi:hypothetical protein